MSFQNVKALSEPSLLAVKGVVGVGGSKEKIRVYVEGSPGFDVLPRSIAGYDIEIIKVGHIRALSMLPLNREQELAVALGGERTTRIRPVVGGTSIGHSAITAGTLGSAIELGGTLYGLSNNHILAAVSTLQYARASIGDVILQPGRADGGIDPDDVIGTLAKYVPLNESGTNLVDCAIFKPTSPDMLSSDILGLAPFNGFREAVVGMSLIKSGRTSGISEGKVLDVDATMSVDYGNFTAVFRHQIVSEFMASPGDSGSLAMDVEDYAAVSLIYAGSEYISMHNHIGDVVDALLAGSVYASSASRLGLLSIPFGLAVVASLVI